MLQDPVKSISSEKICFIISPIGDPDSPERKLADDKYDLIFHPVLTELGYTPIRADKENTPNSISRTIVRRLIDSDLVLADVTGYNANVFYELAIRNAVKKPVIIVKELDQKLPFDVYDKRAISIDMTNNRQWTSAKEELKKYIASAKQDPKSASESILSEYSFDLSSKTPDTQQEMVLTMKDLQDQLRSLRDDIRGQSRVNIESSTDIMKDANFRLGKKRLSEGDKLSFTWKAGFFNNNEEMKIDVSDPKGHTVTLRNSRVEHNTIGFHFNVLEFMTEKGYYSIKVYANNVLVFADTFVII